MGAWANQSIMMFNKMKKKMIVILLLTMTIINKSIKDHKVFINPDETSMLKQCHSNIPYQINQEYEIIIILSISLRLSNHHQSLMVSSLSINQYMRMYNGNTGMNILQINTGNGNFMLHATELEDVIHETAADIVIISESNADTHDIVEEQ